MNTVTHLACGVTGLGQLDGVRVADGQLCEAATVPEVEHESLGRRSNPEDEAWAFGVVNLKPALALGQLGSLHGFVCQMLARGILWGAGWGALGCSI